MSDNTGIEWTDATWNPVRGCSRVSEGCRHCYAETVAARFSDPGMPYHGLADRTRSGSKWTGVVRLIEEHLNDPLKWRKPRRVFVNSMSDLFHEALTDEQIDRVFAVMALAPQHTFQVLTKRPERMRAYMAHGAGAAARSFDAMASFHRKPGYTGINMPWPPPNVWLGVSVENQATADARISLLLQTPADVRFISAEPLLGPVDLRNYLDGHEDHGTPFSGARTVGGCVAWTPPLNWVIVGGESGLGARPCDVAWVHDIVRQCQTSGVAVFVKQLGADPRDQQWDMGGMVTLRHKKGGDMSEWPEGLRVREFPSDAGLPLEFVS